jgi:hypothetical protein
MIWCFHFHGQVFADIEINCLRENVSAHSLLSTMLTSLCALIPFFEGVAK